MKLFDVDVSREAIYPEGMAMPGFYYLNRSNHHDTQRVRDLLESWFADYPAEERLDLAQRFRSRLRAQHHGAFFELLLHALLRRLGATAEIHPPPSPVVTKRPDFLLHDSSGDAYLEARVAMNETDEEAGARNQLDELYALLGKFDSPDFFINIIGVKRGSAPMPGSKTLKHFLRQQLAGAPWDDAMEKLSSGAGLGSLPRWLFRDRDWIVEFQPVPRSANRRGQEVRSSLGFKMEGAVWTDPRQSIVDAVEAKASKYGDLDLPFVVAVNCLEEADPNLDVFAAFYGSEHWTAHLETGEATFRGRNRDGVWMGKRGAQNVRVSAVLIGYPILAWNIGRAPVCLYHHPFASKRYEGVLTALPQVVFDSGEAAKIRGASLGDIFGLPADWPRV